MEDIKKNNHKASITTLSLAALGVVFGDIGTSPLYTMKEVFSLSKHPVELTQFNVLGILSLIFWSLIMIVSVKYVAFIMRADNRGEGGIMALLSLANKNAPSSNNKLDYDFRHSWGLYVLCRRNDYTCNFCFICDRGS